MYWWNRPNGSNFRSAIGQFYKKDPISINYSSFEQSAYLCLIFLDKKKKSSKGQCKGYLEQHRSDSVYIFCCLGTCKLTQN